MAKVDMKKLFGKPDISITKVSVGKDRGDDMDEKEDDDERLASARAILSAVASKDPEALDLALEEHYRACESSEKDEMSDESEDEMDSEEEAYGTD